MNQDAFVTCAVTGAGATTGSSDRVPVTPGADRGLGARGGARRRGRRPHPRARPGDRARLARRRALPGGGRALRAADVDAVINLTAGMGGDLVLGGVDAPLPLDAGGTDLAGAEERLAHVAELRPEICTLDCGSMNFAAGGDYVMTNTPAMLRAMAARVQALGVRPELEVFDFGHLVLVEDLIRDGLIDDPALIQLCMGIPYGAPDDPATLMALVHAAPARRRVLRVLDRAHAAAVRRARGARRRQRARRAGGQPLPLARPARHERGARRARAVTILEAMNVRVLGPDEVRERLGLVRGMSRARRAARRRRDRRRLGRALPARRRRRPALRPGARGRARRRARCSTTRAARTAGSRSRRSRRRAGWRSSTARRPRRRA